VDNQEYRTQEQFESMYENAYNGNWTDSYNNAVKYGFYFNDMSKALYESEWLLDGDGEPSKDAIDRIGRIAEGAMKLRGEKGE